MIKDTNYQSWHIQISTEIPMINFDIFKSAQRYQLPILTYSNQYLAGRELIKPIPTLPSLPPCCISGKARKEQKVGICGRLDAMFESNWRENRSVANLMLESWRGRGNDKKLRICHKFAAFDIAWSKLSFLSVTFIHSRFKISNSIH